MTGKVEAMSDSNSGDFPTTRSVTRTSNVESPDIGDPLAMILDGVAELANAHFRLTSSTDRTGILRRMVAVKGEVKSDSQSVYIRTSGSMKLGAKPVNIAILRISDHINKQKSAKVETQTLRVDDVIRWTHQGIDMGRWADVTDKFVRLKHIHDPDVVFMLDSDDANTKIGEGFDKIIEMIKKVFSENEIDVDL